MNDTTLDFDARYSVAHMPGVAWRLIKYVPIEVEEPYSYVDEDGETIYDSVFVEDINPNMVIAVMIGDDRKHEIDVDDLILIDEDDYCHECGQMGCTHDGRDRS